MSDDNNLIGTTTIALTRKVRDRLKKYGHKGESYDDLIDRLLNVIDRCSE